MNDKEKIIKLLDYVPEYKFAYILEYVNEMAAETNYNKDAECKGNKANTLEECTELWGIV